MVRERMSVAKVLGAKLREIEWLDPSHGHWRSPVGQARWLLEPADNGFWLVMEGTGSAASDHDPRAASRRWPWPLKAIRQGSGGPWVWCARSVA